MLSVVEAGRTVPQAAWSRRGVEAATRSPVRAPRPAAAPDWPPWSGLCLEPLDPVGQATDLSLEPEGANQSDDGDEDPEENEQRSQYPEHRCSTRC